MTEKIKILVLCTGNSCRSQMAEGYLQHFAGDRAEVYSAGIEVHGLNPLAVKVMQEDGIDISHHTSNHVDEYRDVVFDYVITVCDHAREHCPYFPARVKILHHSFSDPARAQGDEQAVIQQFRHVRDQIKSFCLAFVKQYGLSSVEKS